jgi:hypothetical protein
MTSLIAGGSPFLENCAGFHSKVRFLPPCPVAASSRIAGTPEATPNSLKGRLLGNFNLIGGGWVTSQPFSEMSRSIQPPLRACVRNAKILALGIALRLAARFSHHHG